MSNNREKGPNKTVGAKKPPKQGTLFSFFSKKDKPISQIAPHNEALINNAKSDTDTFPDSSSLPNSDLQTIKENTEISTRETAPELSSYSHHPISQVKVDDFIEVYWADDEEWYKAKVLRQTKNTNKFYIQYNIDGQCEWIDLATESFRLVTNSRKRRILSHDSDQEVSGDENEFVPPDSEEENDGTDEDYEEDHLEITDDDDEATPENKQKIRQKIRFGEVESQVPEKRRKTDDKRSTMPKLTRYAATSCPVTVTQHSNGLDEKMTPSNSQNHSKIMSTPKHITPPTSSTTGLSGKSNIEWNVNTVESACSNAATPLATAKIPSTLLSTTLPPSFEIGALNPAGSHVHNHLPFLQNPRDSYGRSLDNPNYDPRTLQIQERDWIRITGKKMTDAVKQWWDLKAMYFDTVLLFKTGKFYEMFHMDADIGVQVCGLLYMKGHVAHAGFPEISYGSMADKLVRAGYKVARVEQTETPEQLGIRKKTYGRGSQVPKVVNREVCSILTMGTRTFCYLDDESTLLHEDSSALSKVGPLLSIREVLLSDEETYDGNCAMNGESKGVNCDDNVEPVSEYGITLVDAIRGTITIGQFADDVLRSRLVTLLTTFSPSEVLIEGGAQGASTTLRTLLKSLQTNFSERRFLIETIQPNESFPHSTALDPNIRKQLARSDVVHPWDVAETLTELHRRQYFPRASKIQSEKDDVRSVSRWPKVLRAAVEGKADLALSSFGAALFYLQRNLIDGELLSMGNVLAYIPPNTAVASKSADNINTEIEQLAEEHNFQQSGLSGNDLALSISQLHPEISSENGVTFMALDGTTLHNLEILTNSVDQKVTGSLWSKINYTKTPHGSRLLRAWLLRPLFCKHHIERRLDAVEELLGGSCAMALNEAKSILTKCGDIERLLSRVHSMSGEGVCTDRIHPNERAVLYETVTYTKRKVGDFAKVLHGLRYASQIPDLFCGIEIRSGLIRKIVQFSDQGGCFPRIADDLDWFFSNFDLDQAAKGFFEPGKGIDELYDTACDTVDRILLELREYKDHMCSTVLTPRALAKSSWKYINTKPDSKDKYFIELPVNIAVPDDFILKGKRGTGPKQINKYLSPVIQQLVHEMERAYDVQKERKAKGMELIFAKFDSKRSVWEAVAHSTALLDALGSLAMTASKSGYVRPIILDCPTNSSPRISVLKGRHPCVENTFNSMEFIPNDLQLGCSSSCLNNTSAKVLLLSGPNMGGKSTLLRQTCLIAILAQIGTFVPAEHCELTPFDRIFTRLGASDRILLNQSTFFVELAETAAALRGASRRSLVIMDELGRGTSTFDGTAIASATVQHLIEHNKCLTLFATHYHSLLEEWKTNNNVILGHMRCLVEQKSTDTELDDCNITFLYTLGPGACPKSFGINVARLAGLPDEVLIKAKRISAEFENEMHCANHTSVRSLTPDMQKKEIINAIRLGAWSDLEILWEDAQVM